MLKRQINVIKSTALHIKSVRTCPCGFFWADWLNFTLFCVLVVQFSDDFFSIDSNILSTVTKLLERFSQTQLCDTAEIAYNNQSRSIETMCTKQTIRVRKGGQQHTSERQQFSLDFVCENSLFDRQYHGFLKMEAHQVDEY